MIEKIMFEANNVRELQMILELIYNKPQKMYINYDKVTLIAHFNPKKIPIVFSMYLDESGKKYKGLNWENKDTYDGKTDVVREYKKRLINNGHVLISEEELIEL